MGEQFLFFEPNINVKSKSKTSKLSPKATNATAISIAEISKLHTSEISSGIHKVLSRMNFDNSFISDLAFSFPNYANFILLEIEDSISKQDTQRILKLSHSLKCVLVYLFASTALYMTIDLGKAAVADNFLQAESICILLKNEISLVIETLNEQFIGSVKI